jgi:ribosomal protein S6--L-glutamate ligase
MKPKNVKLTILSRGPGLYSTMRLAYEARTLKWRVRVINPLSVTLHMAPKPTSYVNRQLHEPNAVIARIGNSITHQGVSVVRHLSFSGIPVINQPDAILRSRNKLEAHQILVSQGLDMPATVYVAGHFDIEELVYTLGPPPWVIKVVSGTQGIGVLLANSVKEAEAQLEFAAASKTAVLVQRFVAEAKGADIRAFVVGNEVIAAMKRQAPSGEFRSNIHRGGSAKRYRLSNLEKATAIKAARALGLEVAGVDMLLSNNGPLLMEVNSSPGIEGIENSTGINIAQHIIEYLHTRLKDCWATQLLNQHSTTPPVPQPAATATVPTIVAAGPSQPSQTMVPQSVSGANTTGSTLQISPTEPQPSPTITKVSRIRKKKAGPFTSFTTDVTPSSDDSVQMDSGLQHQTTTEKEESV